MSDRPILPFLPDPEKRKQDRINYDYAVSPSGIAFGKRIDAILRKTLSKAQGNDPLHPSPDRQAAPPPFSAQPDQPEAPGTSSP